MAVNKKTATAKKPSRKASIPEVPTVTRDDMALRTATDLIRNISDVLRNRHTASVWQRIFGDNERLDDVEIDVNDWLDLYDVGRKQL